MTNPNGESSTIIQDGAGRTVLSIDGLGHTKTMTYDLTVAGISGSQGTLLATTMTDALSHSNTQYADAAGRVLDTYDGRNLKTLEAYPDDDVNLHTGVNDHVSFAYDAAHRPASKLDQAGNTISYVFDMADRLTSRNYPDSNNDTFNFLKWGITQNMATRYPKSFMADRDIFEYARGSRADMLRLERGLVETQPGPLSCEPWAGTRIGGHRNGRQQTRTGSDSSHFPSGLE